MNIRHPGQLKKWKSWEPFWSYQLNSTANPAHLPQNWTKSAVLFLRFSARENGRIFGKAIAHPYNRPQKAPKDLIKPRKTSKCKNLLVSRNVKAFFALFSKGKWQAFWQSYVPPSGLFDFYISHFFISHFDAANIKCFLSDKIWKIIETKY